MERPCSCSDEFPVGVHQHLWISDFAIDMVLLFRKSKPIIWGRWLLPFSVPVCWKRSAFFHSILLWVTHHSTRSESTMLHAVVERTAWPFFTPSTIFRKKQRSIEENFRSKINSWFCHQRGHVIKLAKRLSDEPGGQIAWPGVCFFLLDCGIVKLNRRAMCSVRIF